MLMFLSISVFASENIEVKLVNYQYSKNLISFQLEITNNSDEYMIIPDYYSCKWELIDTKLIITYYYDFAELFGIVDICLLDTGSPKYVIESNGTIYYSVYLINEYVKVFKYGVYDEEMFNTYKPYSPIEDIDGGLYYQSFNKILGTIKSVEINIAVVEKVGGYQLDLSRYFLSKQQNIFTKISTNFNLEEQIVIEYKNYSRIE